jgi:hypothetical protein
VASGALMAGRLWLGAGMAGGDVGVAPLLLDLRWEDRGVKSALSQATTIR